MKNYFSFLKKPITYLYLFLFIITFLLSSHMHYNADEFNYAHITWTSTKISSIADILKSQELLYLNWTGRVLVHFLIQLVIYLNHYTFPLLNSLIFCGFIYLISNLFYRNKSIHILLITFAITWTCLPVFGETILWISGSINYLWPSFMLLLFIYSYKNDKLKTPWIMLLAFLAGVSQEIVFIAGGSYLLFDLCTTKFKKKNIFIYISFLLGNALLLLAPGNFIRAAQSKSNFFSNDNIKIMAIMIILFIFILLINLKYKNDFFNLTKKLANKKYVNALVYLSFLSLIPLAIISSLKNPCSINKINIIFQFRIGIFLIILFTIALLKCIYINASNDIILSSITIATLGLIDLLAMSIMPEFPDRSRFLSYTFIIISIIQLVSCINIKKSYLLFAPIYVLSAFTLLITLKFYLIHLNEWNTQFNSQLEKYKNSSVAIVPIQPNPSLRISDKYGAAPTKLTVSCNSVTNYYAARYYNFDEIIGVEPNSYVIKIEKENIDKASLCFEFINEHGDTERRYAENTFIEPTKADKEINQAYFLLPSSATDVQFMNNSSIDITNDDMTVFTLD